MGQEKEIDLDNPDEFESTFDQESVDTIQEVLDERDYIRPLKKSGEESLDPVEINIPMAINDPGENELEMLINANDDQTEISQPENNPQAELSAENKTNDFWGFDEDETGHLPTEPTQSESKKYMPDTLKAEGNSEKFENNDASEDKRPLIEIADQRTKAPEAPKRAIKFSIFKTIIGVALVALIIVGFVFYQNPSLIRLIKVQRSENPAPDDAIETIAPVGQLVSTPSITSNRDQCIAKIEEAVRLRDVLLVKNEEIYELDLHYRNGIAELEEETYQEIKRGGTTAYKAAMQNKRIELNMRTIQRRRAYINGLIKPASWLNIGSEELFYLIRKAQLDMQLTEIAGGIDLNMHMRHINAAIQKYRPSPDKLAVDPAQSKVQPLKKIWEQVSRQKQGRGIKKKKEKFALNPKDKLIINQICSGNFERISELTNISSRAARCLAQMKGSDLFLNGLVTLSPDVAQQLFQWQGNWVCLNGVKNLSPAAAQYLFKWKGNWISLNSLNEFTPELAVHLLKWEGQQLELMGLQYNKNEVNQKTLKYLALWETTGGKLFVTDKIRQEMESLM